MKRASDACFGKCMLWHWLGMAWHGAIDSLMPSPTLHEAGEGASSHAHVVFTETLKQPGALQAHQQPLAATASLDVLPVVVCPLGGKACGKCLHCSLMSCAGVGAHLEHVRWHPEPPANVSVLQAGWRTAADCCLLSRIRYTLPLPHKK